MMLRDADGHTWRSRPRAAIDWQQVLIDLLDRRHTARPRDGPGAQQALAATATEILRRTK